MLIKLTLESCICIQSIYIYIKPTGEKPLRRPRRRWEDNIRMDLKEIGINTRNWVDSAQDTDYWRALVNGHWTSGFHKPCS